MAEIVEGRFGDYEKIAAKGTAMVELVRMECALCGNPIQYFIEGGCPHCGLIHIECKFCNYKFSFGE